MSELSSRRSTCSAASRCATTSSSPSRWTGRPGLSDALGKRPEQLSGGEQQRVAIARALIADPDVVLADEPTGNLDIEGTRRICELLRGLNGTEKCAILLVTHDPVVAACAQAVHFLKEGRIVASHDPEGDPARVSELYLETYR